MMNKVFIGGLPIHVDKEGLTDFFSCFGPIIDVRLFFYIIILTIALVLLISYTSILISPNKKVYSYDGYGTEPLERFWLCHI